MPREAEEAAIAFLERLDPASQVEVLRHFEDVLNHESNSQSRRLRRVALALHEARRIYGRSPSVREYKAMCRKNPEWGWPDPRSITRWLGVRSWNDALVRLRLEPVLEGDLIEGAIGPAYTIDEVTQALRDCADDLGRPPTITQYLAWQMRPDVRDRPGRRPASTWVFNRIFAGFPEARVAAGLVDDGPTAAHPSGLLLRVANYRVSDKQILEDIRHVAARTQGHLTAIVYDRERRLVYEETKVEGRPRALAGIGTIYRHFGTWRAALEAAGLSASRRVEAPGSRGRPQLPRKQMLQALSDAFEATEGRLTVDTYAEWRREQIKRRPDGTAAPPVLSTFFRRFGSWKKAIEEMHKLRTSLG